MIRLTEEEIKNFQEWSEGNKYLFELLCNCRKNGIKTFASCGGHEVTLNTPYEEEDYSVFPYIGINIDENSLPYIKQIIERLKNMQNIIMDAGFLEENGVFTITGHHSNCCEMFSRINMAIINGMEIDSTSKMNALKKIYYNVKARHLIQITEKILQCSRAELLEKNVSYRYDTFTSELSRYTRSEGVGFADRERIPNFDELYKKYGFLQKEYYPKTKKKLIALQGIETKEKLASWDLQNWNGEMLDDINNLNNDTQATKQHYKNDSDREISE